jgi:Aminoglycoside-2''-adenylyltransferase
VTIHPRAAAEFLAGCDAPWWIAGGWALDLFLGSETRPHDDLDIAVLRRDQALLHRHLDEWDLCYVTPDHALVPWEGEPLSLPVHEIWAQRSPWTIELLLNEHEGDRWIYRRHPAVACALDDLGGSRDGIPFLRPEVVLLFKSKDPTPKDERDFDAVRPHLPTSGVGWLREALMTTAPRHKWLARLRDP